MVWNGFSHVFHKKGKAAVNKEKSRNKAEGIKGVRKKVSVVLR